MAVASFVVDDVGVCSFAGMNSHSEMTSLYHEHHTRVFRICMSLLRCEADAEDATQETFARVMPRMRVISGEVGAYLTTVARHLCYHELSHRSRYSTPIADEYPSLPDATDGVVLEGVWSKLSRESQSMLAHFFAGYSYLEIASLTGLSLSAVTSKVWRARQQARDLVG